jgi:hypothetical protein
MLILAFSLNHHPLQQESKQNVNVTEPVAISPEPGKAEFKSFMDYRTISSQTSDQSQLQRFSQTGEYGIRIYNYAYMIAVGSGWGFSVGDYVIILFDQASPIGCVVGDIKSDSDTDKLTHTKDKVNGSIIEFIVQTEKIPKKVQISGSFNSVPIFNHKILAIYAEEMPYD